MLLTFHIAHANRAAPTWVVDPAVPGADVPAVGMSAFDAVTLDARGTREVPFPFEKLLARIEAAAGCKDDERCTRAALIPLGRSLQRVAASPNFFAHPRIVVAVTEEGAGGQALRDRLFLGYQAAQGVIEAISYNDALGRFEFQIVKNYREGARPEVFQARRTICLSCHQNHAPIFSRQTWSETNANPRVAAALMDYATAFVSVEAQGNSEVSNAIDDATDRANGYALTQVLWQEGCGAGESGHGCRRTLLAKALQYALSGGRASFDDRQWQTSVVARLQATAATRWPGGLAVPNPDIPNRDPFSQPLGNEGAAFAHIPAKLEPLSLRAPLEILPASGETMAKALVRGMAATWSPARLAALDRALLARRAVTRTQESPCRIERRGALMSFACGNANADSIQVVGSLTASDVRIDSIRVGIEPPLRYPEAAQVVAASQSLSFVPRHHNRSARTANASAITQVELQWSGSAGTARLRIRDDFDSSLSDAHSLHGAFNADSIDAVIATAGGVDHVPCCVAVHPASLVEPAPPPVAAGLAADLEPHCGSCHRTPDSAPANFLSGDRQRVQRQLARCAPRIYVRLSMSDVPAPHRAKTPMPPGSTRQDAQADRAVAKLRSRVASLLREEYGRVPSLDELLSSGYERLRPCLAESSVDKG